MDRTRPYRQELPQAEALELLTAERRWRDAMAAVAERREELRATIARLEERGFTRAAIARTLRVARQRVQELMG